MRRSRQPLRSLRGTRVCVALAAALAAAACTVGPDYQRPDVPVPAAYKEAWKPGPKAAGWRVGRPEDAADRGAWWSIYDDPVLDGLERQIDISNQTLKAAEAAYRQAEAIVAEARAGFFPTLAGHRTRRSAASVRAPRRPDLEFLQRDGVGKLDARSLGPDPPHRRRQCRERPGQRRRSRERPAVGAGQLATDYLAAAHRGRAEAPARRLGHGL